MHTINIGGVDQLKCEPIRFEDIRQGDVILSRDHHGYQRIGVAAECKHDGASVFWKNEYGFVLCNSAWVYDNLYLLHRPVKLPDEVGAVIQYKYKGITEIAHRVVNLGGGGWFINGRSKSFSDKEILARAKDGYKRAKWVLAD